MSKKLLPLLIAPLLLAGCQATFTNLTPQTQLRSTNNLYQVEVALASRDATLRWQSIHPQIVVGKETYPMRLTPLMNNRWEGLVPVPASTSMIHYRYRFDYEYNAFGKPKPDTLLSPEYVLRVKEQQ